MSKRTPAEAAAVTRVSRFGQLAKRAQSLHTADRQAEEAARIVAVAQSAATQAILDTAPLLTPEQIARCRAVFSAVGANQSAPRADQSAPDADQAA